MPTCIKCWKQTGHPYVAGFGGVSWCLPCYARHHPPGALKLERPPLSHPIIYGESRF